MNGNLNIEKVRKLILSKKYTLAESLLLLCIVKNQDELSDFALSFNGYAFSDDGKRVDYRVSYGNNHVSLEAFYSLKEKFNDLDWKNILETALMDALKSYRRIARTTEVVHNILWYQKSGKATFEIDCVKVLEEARRAVNNNKDFLSRNRAYYLNRPLEIDINLIKKYNQRFIEELGFDIFDTKPNKKKK